MTGTDFRLLRPKQLYAMFIILIMATLMVISGISVTSQGGVGPASAASTPDEYEPDNTWQQANLISFNETQFRNFHQPGDEDWVSFNAEAGQRFRISTLNLEDNSDTYLYLYIYLVGDNGLELLTQNDDYYGLDSRINWTAQESGTFYAKVRHYSSSTYGEGTGYELRLTELAPSAEGVEILSMYPSEGSQVGLWAWFETYGFGAWQKVDYEYSQDGETWGLIGTDNWPWIWDYDESLSESFSYIDWNNEDLPEGNYQIRATAYDFFGNTSSRTQNYFLNQPPLPPTNLEAESNNENITLTWKASPTNDVKEYRVYRSKSKYAWWYEDEDVSGDSGENYSSGDSGEVYSSGDSGENYSSGDSGGDYSSGDFGDDYISGDYYDDYWYTPYKQIATVPAVPEQEIYSYVDNTVETGSTYYYTVKAVDELGSKSEPSNRASGNITPDFLNPEVIYMWPHGQNNNRIGISAWFSAEAFDDVGLKRFVFEYSGDNGTTWNLISVDNDFWDYDNWAWATAYWNTEDLPEGNYRVRATAYDFREKSASLSRLYYLDKTAPEAITDLTAIPGEGFIKLNWSESDAEDFGFYNVYRATESGNGELGWEVVTPVSSDAYSSYNSYKDVAVSPDATYYYVVTASDDVGNESGFSNEVSATALPDEIAPTVLDFINGSDDRIRLWTYLGAIGTDNAAWKRVLFEYSSDGETWHLIGENSWPWKDDYYYDEETGEWKYDPESTRWSAWIEWDASQLEEGYYKVRATAFDYWGNSGSLTREFFLDMTAPEAIQDLTATPVEGAIDLNWSVPSGDAIPEYRIYKATEEGNGEIGWDIVSEVSPDAYSNYNFYKDVNVSPDATYYYVVTSVDKADNVSEISNEVSASPLPDGTSPVVTAIWPLGNKIGGGYQWLQAVGTDNAAWRSTLFEYSFDDGDTWHLIDFNDNSWYDDWSDPENPFWRSGVDWNNDLPEGNYKIRVTAYDNWGNSGSLIKDFYLDRTPPEAPTELSAKPGRGYVDLAWTASSSEDVAYYNIYKSNEPGAGQFGWWVASVDATTTYRDIKVNSKQMFYYAVSAVDDVSNSSDFSNEASATSDRTKPIINLDGSTDAIIEVGSTFTVPGVIATDNYDGDITDKIVKTGEVDSTKVGSYTISYNVTDTAGNAADEVTRTVNVVDTTKPVITLTGESTINIEVGSTFTDAGATASDNYDGDITGRIVKTGEVDTTTVGTYTLNYNVSDTAGNVADEVNRTVNVTADITKPVVSANSIVINNGANYTSSTNVMLKLSATDNVAVTKMRISNLADAFSDPDFGWEDYITDTKEWTLEPGEGVKTVYAQFKDAAGNISDTASDTIILKINVVGLIDDSVTEPLLITVPSDSVDPVLDVSSLRQEETVGDTTKTTVTIPITVSVNVDVPNKPYVSVQIPAGTKITGPSDWDGLINLPTIKDKSKQQVGLANNTVDLMVIEIGLGDVPLTFDKAVRLQFDNRAGKRVGFTRAGVFTQITKVLSEDSQAAGDALPEAGDGYIKVGGDLVVWTKHFTEFVTYSEDTTKPSLTITAPSSGKHLRGVFQIGVQASDPTVLGVSAGFKEVKIYRGSTLVSTINKGSFTYKVDSTKLTDGKKTFKLVAYDKAGNSTSLTREYYVDNTKPTIPSAYMSPTSPTKGKYAKAYYKLGDKISPKVKVTVQIRTTGGKVLTKSDLGAKAKGKLLYKSIKMPAKAGTYIYRVIATDYAGNKLIKNVRFSVK